MLGAIVMDGCEIESDAMLAAGALLTVPYAAFLTTFAIYPIVFAVLGSMTQRGPPEEALV